MRALESSEFTMEAAMEAVVRPVCIQDDMGIKSKHREYFFNAGSRTGAPR